jgi:phage tail sheath protein FI
MPKKLNVPGVYIEEASSKSHTISGVATSITGFIGSALGGPVNRAVRILSLGDYNREFGGLSYESPMSYTVMHYFLNGGQDAYIVRVAKRTKRKNSAGGIIGFKEIQLGLKAFDKVDLINLLCIPPFSFQHDVDLQTWKAAVEYCASRRAFLIIDQSTTWKKPENVRASLEDSNAALYYPHLIMTDPLNGNAPAVFAPCGAVAGVIARIDTQHGIWKAPAGSDAVLTGVLGLNASLSDLDADNLNRLGINCIRYMPSHGPVIWGARTLQGVDSFVLEWKYINVRRLALFIEESLYRGLKWAVFEPNDESLWAKIRQTVGNFLQGLFLQGAFLGTTPREAYFVKCDRGTISQRDIDQGIVNLLVGFAPLKPAEFVIIKIQLKT